MKYLFPHALSTTRLSLAPCNIFTAQNIAEIIADTRVHAGLYGERQDRPGLAGMPGAITLVAQLRDSGEVAGAVHADGDDFAYFIAPHYWEQGLGYEMAAACLPAISALMGRDGLDAYVIRENTASRRILERCGCTFSGLLFRPWGRNRARIAVLHYRYRLPLLHSPLPN